MSRKEQIKEFFIFTRGEKKGIIVLVILIVIAILINQFSHVLYKESNNDFSEFKSEIAEFEKSLISKEEKYNKNSYYDKMYDTLQLFSFNPNNTSKKDWILLGLSEKQINTINNWQSKGGKFRYKSDLKKIYGISENQYNILYPYIDLPVKNSEYKTEDKYYSDYQKDINTDAKLFDFDPNTISDEEWISLGFSGKQVFVIRKYINNGGKFLKKEDLKKIYVISDEKYKELSNFIKIKKDDIEENSDEIIEKQIVFVDINSLSTEEMKEYGRFWQYNATRIVKYRNLLGGYYKKEQLLEVYGMKREYYDKVADDIIIDISKIEKIHINFAEVSELGRHPYISYKEAKEIIEYRNKNGAYKQLNELVNKNIISKSLYDKISPYLKVK